jgi:acid phosphatase (class A)|tara:strand:- start:628 stop:1260 length:633 start_codon:yes stop_codon:yes gene_type:complete
MIKLKELLTLRSMKYYTTEESIKRKHQERMDMKTSLWDENIILPRMMPPENDSSLTLKEIKYLAEIEPSQEVAEMGDDVLKNFMDLIEKHEVNVSEEMISRIIKESGKFIMQLKYHYNRPRPYQIAEFYQMDLNGTTLDSMKTPSYPSGHATQGYLIGEYLASVDNLNGNIYRDKAEEIAESRIIAKAHYPSDKAYGKTIAKALFRGMRK